jgi:putative ABC transport system permease protein
LLDPRLMTTLFRDARFGLRLLRRNPGFTAVAVATLALGISATTAIFSVVYGLFFAPLPYRQPDRLVMVWEQDRGRRDRVSPKNFVAWRRQATAFADINAWGGGGVNLATADRPENVVAGRATPGFLGMMGYGHPLALGRSFREEEGVVGQDKVVILTYRLWKDRFAGDPGIVGRQVRIDDMPYTVVGVLGEGPADHQQNKIWLPLAFTEAQLQADFNSLLVMARLKDDVSLSEANASMAALNAALEQERPVRREGRSVSVEPFRNNFVSDSTKRGIWLLLGAVMFLLLIACANVANLLLARGTARQRELAIRTAMGATGAAIVRQLLVESLVLALAGGLLGAALASAIIDAIVALMPAFTLPSETEITLSIPVLLFALIVCTLAGVAAGLAPAWQASRGNAPETMKEGGRSVGDRRHGLRRTLVVLEFALALTLLTGGGLAVHALVRMMSADPGFRDDHLLTFFLPVPRGRIDAPEQMHAFYTQLSERIGGLPGVRSVAVSTGMPVVGPGFGQGFEIVGKPVANPQDRRGTGVNMVTPSYHATFGIRVLQGRSFADSDRAGSMPVAIVNEAFATRFLSGVDPIGQRVLMSPFVFGRSGPEPPPVEWEIVGVQADVVNMGPGREPRPELIVPFRQMPWPRALVAVQTTGDAAGLQPAIADLLYALDPSLPMANVRTIEQTLSQSVAADRFYTVFFASFAIVALVLAAVGIYGVMSFVVAQRTHEIGLRMALGGQPGQVLAHVLREGMGTALAGTALGGVGAVLIGRALEGAVYGVRSTDPLTFAVVALTLLAAALVACVVPARRAARVDPMVALRQV